MGWINQLLKHTHRLIYKTQVHFSDKPLPLENFTPFFQFDYTLRAGSSFFQKRNISLSSFQWKHVCFDKTAREKVMLYNPLDWNSCFNVKLSITEKKLEESDMSNDSSKINVIIFTHHSRKPDNFDYLRWPSWVYSRVSTWNSKLDKEWSVHV